MKSLDLGNIYKSVIVQTRYNFVQKNELKVQNCPDTFEIVRGV